MAWLQGSSTWQTIDTDICKLLTGTMNDGVGANAGVDAWLYDLQGSSFPCIRTPSAMDIALPASMSNRTGYWALCYSNTTSGPATLAGQPGATPFLTTCVVTTPLTSLPGSPSHGRVLFQIQITVANTTPGNYSTARFNYGILDPDTGALISSQSNQTFSAAGVTTLLNGLTVTITDPSGTLPVGAGWARGFTSTYLYGIDWWPSYTDRSAAPTFSTAPPGVAGTDYDLIDGTCSSSANFLLGYGPGYNYSHFSGLGIKTATGFGGGGVRYTISAMPMSQQKVTIVKSATSAGSLDLILGPSCVDTLFGSVLRPANATLIASWLTFATTPGSVTNAMVIQYWIQVKPSGFVIVLNADPGQTGKMGVAAVVKMTNLFDATNDVSPWIASPQPSIYYQDSSNYSLTATWRARRGYPAWRRMNDGSWGTRDWQNGYMRSDWGAGVIAYSGAGNAAGGLGQLIVFPGFAADMGSGSQGLGVSYGYMYEQNTQPHPTFDGTWWLTGVACVEGPPTQVQTEQVGLIRGYSSDHWAMISGGGWGNGDELTDSVNGAKWMLTLPDFTGIPGRIRTAPNTFNGGIAVRENL